MIEYELTYLAKSIPIDLKNFPHKEILDIYIPSQSPHPVLRIRKSGDKMEITKKEPISGKDSSEQLETTIPLNYSEYSEIEGLPGKRVKKERYYYKENDIQYEVDVFKDDLLGLVLVDIEFLSSEEKEKFVPPQWCLAEITQEAFVAGGMLCGKKYSDIEERLKKYGYNKIFLQ